ncbi:MAG: dTDP-4-dehydrorhamnose 3,5-epimerase [Candidatus Binatia bacterium]
MPFRFIKTEISEIVVVEPRVFPDERGFFMETYKRSEFAAQGIDEVFVQVNHSRSSKGTLRGLHYQKHPKAQGKLVRAVAGEIFDVAVDIRQGAPTFGKSVVVSLSSENKKILYVPAGFAHGFCVVSDEAEIAYMTTAEYAPECEAGVRWDDPALAISWPLDDPKLSNRDLGWPFLKDADNNFHYDAMAAVGDSTHRNH